MSVSNDIKLVGKDGPLGMIEHVTSDPDTSAQGIVVRLEDGQRLLVPLDAVVLREDGTYYLPMTRTEIETHLVHHDLEQDGETVVVPVIVEEVAVEKRQVETGKVRLTKIVHEREERIDEPLLQEEVLVERFPIQRVVDQPVPVRYEGETMIIPILEEVLVVEKRLMLKEEVHITKHQTETHEPQQVTLRSEEVLIERMEGGEK